MRRLTEGEEDESKEGTQKQETKTSQKSKMASLVGDSRLGERYDLDLPQLRDCNVPDPPIGEEDATIHQIHGQLAP